VKETRADLGIALDGDGDRLVMVDSEGVAYDGDQLLYVIAMDAQRRGRLSGGVVGTLMSNLAFELALGTSGIPFERAKVGDRYVLELMLSRGWRLGGENSGHILCLDQHTTGDGIVAALQVLCALRAGNTTLKNACAPVALFPQVMINVPVKQKKDHAKDPRVAKALQDAQSDLGDDGRVLLRPSGTEPVIRVMVEARSRSKASRWAKAIADVVGAAS
jgi:phosphoglucosamine mutase